MLDPQFEALLRPRLEFLPAEEPLGPADNLSDYGLDSLGIVDLLASLESNYQVRFTDDALNLRIFSTPGTLWEALTRLRASAA
jgi:acyl carrier protein